MRPAFNLGLEPVDNTVIESPTRLRLPFNRAQQMRDFIRQELSRSADAQGRESFEEADDFELDEEDVPLSRYEVRDLDGEPESASPTSPPANPGVAAPAARAPDDPARGVTSPPLGEPANGPQKP